MAGRLPCWPQMNIKRRAQTARIPNVSELFGNMKASCRPSSRNQMTQLKPISDQLFLKGGAKVKTWTLVW